MSSRTELTTINKLSERMIDGLAQDEHPFAHRLHSHVLRLRAACAALIDLHDTPDPTATEAAHFKRVSQAAQKLAGEIEALRERTANTVREGLLDIDRRIAQKVKLIPDAHAAEIRQVFRGMNSTERIKLLSELAENNRGPELAAIVKSPTILTGVSVELRDRFEEQIIFRHAPAEHAEQQALMAAHGTAISVPSVATAIAQKYSDPGKLASIERGERMAALAEAAFAGSLSAPS